MPTTTSGLWADLVDFENLHSAYLSARLGKRFRNEVMMYAANAEENIANLQRQLTDQSWLPGPPREFIVLEPKRRLIQAPPFSDRVLHHALINVVEPLFEKRFIYDSYACRKGKGTQAAVNRVQRFIRLARRRWGDGCYIVQADISKYFASINHETLMREVERAVSDKKILKLWRSICAGYGSAQGVGIPVGALTSQLGANIMLDRLDHFAKDDLGLKFYVRYMDDFVVVAPNKQAAREILDKLEVMVKSLNLSLNPKTTIHPWQRGVDFCGYRTWPTHILPRKRNIKRARRSFRKLADKYKKGGCDLNFIQSRVHSFIAYTKHCDAQRTVAGVLGDLALTLPNEGRH